jgi:S1-C subfamily serine protease
VDSISALKEIPFTKTKSSERKMTAFKVTLGIMADYAFGGPGVKVDGVSPGKAAEKAGILAGDLVLKLGEHETSDIYKYMEALGKFTKGEKTFAEIRRGKDVIRKEVEF